MNDQLYFVYFAIVLPYVFKELPFHYIIIL